LDDMSIQAITAVKPCAKSILKKKKSVKIADAIEEESAYQKHFQWLQDHGETMADAATEKSDNKSVDTSSEDE